MTDADRIEALLNIVDPERTERPDESEQLAVHGFVERRGKKGFWPTNAGWNLMGDRPGFRQRLTPHDARFAPIVDIG